MTLSESSRCHGSDYEEDGFFQTVQRQLELALENEMPVFFQGREWTAREWADYQLALAKSEKLWEESDKEILERMRSQPLPPLVIKKK